MSIRSRAFALALLTSAVSVAHSADTLEEIVVTATGQTRANAGTKTDTPLIETPQSISVVTREELDVRAVHTVTEALAYTAGVQSESDGIDSRVDDVTVRGFDAGSWSNNLFVDGLRIPPGGQWTRASFDPYSLQQVEVLKGPSAVLFGQVSPGGIVNLVSRRPQDTPHAELSLQTAAFTKLDGIQGQVAGDVGGAIDEDGHYLYRVVGLARDGDTQIDETEIARYYLGPSFTWAPSQNTTLTLLGQYQRDEGGATFQFLPMTGTLQPGAEGFIGHDTYLGEPDFNTFDRDQILFGYAFEHRFSDALRVRQNARYTHLETLYETTVSSGNTLADGRTLRRRAVRGTGDSDGYAVDTQLQGDFTTGALTHTVLAGLDWFHTDWQHLRLFTANVAPIDIYDPVYSGTAQIEATLAPQTSYDTTSKQTGVYLQDQIAVSNLRVTVGGRYDWAEDDQLNRLNNVTTTTEAEDFTSRIGATWLFDSGFAPYASYSESFQPSTGQYYDGTPFDPTTGDQIEAGVKYQPPGVSAFITLAGYELRQQNITTPDPDTTHVCGTGACSVQTGEATIKGIELEGKASLPFGLSLVGTLTRMDGEITKTNTANELGNTLPQVPEYMGSLWLDYRFQEGALRGLGLGGGVRYVGETYGDTLNTFDIPDYTLYDVFLRYDLGELAHSLKGASFSFNARNLGNERYVATCSSVSSCFYGSGRTLNARVQFAW